MFTPPLRMFLCQFKFCLLADYGRFSNKITCVQNNLPFAIKCFGYASRVLCVLCLNSNFFSQCFLYYNSIFHFVLTLPCDPVLRHGWDEFFVMHAKLRAKILIFSNICKLFSLVIVCLADLLIIYQSAPVARLLLDIQ